MIFVIKVIFLIAIVVLFLFLIRGIYNPHPLYKKPDGKTPDSPINWGYKSTWLAIKSTDIDQVVKKLAPKISEKANWETGMYNARSKYGVFVTPPIDGWILVVGWGLPDEVKDVKAFLERLSTSFEDVQYYSSYRVVSLYSWARASYGKVSRLVFTADGLYESYGEATPLENELKVEDTIAYWNSDIHDDIDDYDLIDNFIDSLTDIDEELVLKFAKNWSIDPMTIAEREGVAGFGICGKKLLG